MNCNPEIHNEIITMECKDCPFCNEWIQHYYPESHESCCLAEELIAEDGQMVCMHCGQVDGGEFANEYINFHENKYKIVKKLIYQRKKYHLEKVINDICCKSVYVRNLYLSPQCFPLGILRHISVFKVAEHSFQVPMPNSFKKLLNHLCFGARFLQELRLTSEVFILAFLQGCVLLPWQRG